MEMTGRWGQRHGDRAVGAASDRPGARVGSHRGPPPLGGRVGPWLRLGMLLAVVVVVAVEGTTGVSVVRALTASGSAGWQTRLVDWVRDHGGGSVVDRVEAWWYSGQPPGDGPPVPPALPVTHVRSRAGVPLPVPRMVGGSGASGAGVWVPVGRLDRGRPVLWATWLTPDAAHRSVTAVVARVDPRRVAARLVAGTREPDGSGWPEGAQVPAADRDRVLAAFNAGFRFHDTPGGFAADGRVGLPLAPGLASAVIGHDGSLTVRRWDGGPAPGPGVAAVRQNLDLIVENFRPVAGLAANAQGRWGSASSQLEYTWRSGLGVGADGTLFYVAGRDLTLASLAGALVDAGARTGMELDIHPTTVTFNLFFPDGPAGLRAAKLVPQMARPATRYLSPDQRDFFELVLR